MSDTCNSRKYNNTVIRCRSANNNRLDVSGRFRRRPSRQDTAHVREERVQLPPIRDILHRGQRVHGLGTDRTAPNQHTGRDNSGTQ